MTADDHLDLLTLDAIRAGEPPTPLQRAHLAWCEPCRATLDDLDTLAAALRRFPPAVEVPRTRDAAILVAARRRAAGARRDHWTGPARRWAVAALLLVAIGGLTALRQRQMPAAPPPRAALTAAQADLDGDGRVTVLDAFALARAFAHGTPPVHGRGRHDVDAILAMAVAVDDVRGTP